MGERAPDRQAAEDLVGLVEELHAETPRAAAILAAAFLDACLRRILANAMVRKPKTVDELLGTDKRADGPLGTFSSRMRAAYCLGLISEREYHDLMVIRDIRNRCAHRLHDFSFDDEAIVSRVASLQTGSALRAVTSENHRQSFELAFVFLATGLGTRARRSEGENPKSPGDFNFENEIVRAVQPG